MGLGLVLMLGGDGEVARRAGDALIADKVQDAVEEGGFDSVEFRSWSKGFDGGRFWVGFSGVDVLRAGASLTSEVAVIYPMSIEMRFEQGRVELAQEAATWKFDGVQIAGSFSLFRSEVTVTGVNLRAADPVAAVLPSCLFRGACDEPVLFDGALDEFRLEMGRSGRAGRFEFGWRSGDQCIRIESGEISVARGEHLSALGRGLLEDRYDGDVAVTRGRCAKGVQASDPEAFAVSESSARSYRSSWRERDAGLDEVLGVLMVSVPEAYEYLVE